MAVLVLGIALYQSTAIDFGLHLDPSGTVSATSDDVL